MTFDPKRAVEMRLQAAVESSPSGLLMIDGAGIIVLVNREIERLFGYGREELLGRPMEMLVPERFRGRHPGLRGGFHADPRVRAMGAGRDLHGLRKDGIEVPIEIGLTPVATEEGLFVLSSIVDISARQRAEARFRAAVEASPNGMVMTDPSGRIVLVNREVERMFGYTRDELLGQSIERLVPARFHGRHPRFRRDFLGRPGARAMGAGRDLFATRKDGSEIPVEIGLNPIETDEGLFVLSSIVDLSARKVAETEQGRLEQQLRQAQKMEAVGTLAGGIAHDFNNILGAIVGYAELIAPNLQGPRSQADLRELLNAAQRGKEIVQRILAFSRRAEAVRTPLPLDATISESAKLLRVALPPSMRISEYLAPGMPRVLADATAVSQILLNLATNAAQAMPRGGEISIRLDPIYVRDHMARANPDLREGLYALLVVEDNGPGMERAVRDRVFEPFFTTKPPGAGTGLGLSIVHGIMKSHQGAVELDSEPGRGTRVRCFFPALSAAPEEAIREPDPTPHGHGERVLLVEDDPSLARIGERRLVELGYAVTLETDSRRALERFRERPREFDLVITDYLMPSMVGIELARALIGIRSDIPIILLTGFMEDLPDQEIQAAGVRRLLQKPVSMHDLGVGVHEILTSFSRS